MRRLLLGLGFCLLLSGCGRWCQVMCWPADETRLVLDDLVAGSGPSELKSQTSDPLQQQIAFRQNEQDYRAELYLPAEKIQAGLLLLPGATTAGANDARLVAFAQTLSRAGFAVLIPDLVNVRALQLHPADVQGGGRQLCVSTQPQ
ncbi:MAG: hypothetical protein IGS03_18265 [Candidatus Sericytochromatia bacterium]|nr:hypothetical protein [Candidatus Sericytochromatia bacterium]